MGDNRVQSDRYFTCSQIREQEAFLESFGPDRLWGEIEARPAGVTYSQTRLFLVGICAFFFGQGLIVGAAAVVLWQAWTR